MRRPRFAESIGHKRRNERSESDLIEQHLDRIDAPQRRRLDDDRRRRPEERSQERERVAREAPTSRPAQKAASDADKGERQPYPLGRPQPLVSKQQRRADSDKERRGVDEHRRSRGGGEAQRFIERDELSSKQRAGQRPRGLRAVNLEDAALGGERVGQDAQRADA